MSEQLNISELSKLIPAFRLAFVREVDEGPCLISNVSASNITLCCGQHVACELRVERNYFTGFDVLIAQNFSVNLE